MNCATHNDLAAVAFCRTCGKALCQNCTRDVRGVIYCESCLAARLEGTAPTPGFVPPQAPYQQVIPPGAQVRVPVSGSGPNPAVAGILAGFFPFGVGQVYCSQYAKGLAHLLIFALLIFAANHAGDWEALFGIGIAFFYVYQIIDAVRTAKAIQAGQPVPDPIGLAQAFGAGQKLETSKVPVGAIVLIALGVLFLLHTMGFWEIGFDRFWPVLIIALGGWMFYRNWERNKQTCMCGRCRTRWLMGPSMVLTTGVLLLLASTDKAPLGSTWPAWLLVIGIIKLLQSTSSGSGHIDPTPPGTPPTTPPPPVPSSDPTMAPDSSSGEVRHV